MLGKQNIDNFKSETLHFPNVNSLMKISLGLILFTMLSTVLVYAETISDTTSVQITENAYLQNTSQYFDISLFSTSTGMSIKIINNDIVSHKLISGTSNSNTESTINYDNFLICDFIETDAATYSTNNSDDNLCDFNKDNRIISDIIPPGESTSILISDVGTYRIIDPDYPWMEFVIYSFSDSESSNVNSGFLTSDKIPEQISTSESITTATPSIETISVNVDGMPFDIQYNAVGLNVYQLESDTDSMSLIFYVDVTDSIGKLDVTFDRMFFDSIYDGEDDLFFVLVDGDETISQEIETTSQSRSLTIEVPSGTEELEIIGSEFGISKELPSISETPVIETPVIETPSTNECGPGTILENDVCVLDQRCGPGTILENDVCVLDSTPSKSPSSGNGRELIMGVTFAFVIAGVIGIIFALISKANRNKH